MERIRKMLLAVVAGSSLATAAIAQLQLPAVFSNGMVLQQKTKVAVWGWGNASERVSIVGSWAPRDTIRTTVSNDGRWSAQLPTAQAGGPYTMDVFAGSGRVHFSDVLLGEVWLCSGQSNMEWSANTGILNGKEEVARADCQRVRILHMPKQGADTPQTDARTRWEVSSPASMRRTSATAYFFARYLEQHLNVPIGIIVAAWGGTPAEVWTPADAIAADKTLSAVSHQPTAWWPDRPGVLFNQMIHPVAPYGVAGCIWYQGESNRDHPDAYCRLMTRLVESWRDCFAQPLPFYYVQIAPYTYNDPKNGPAIVREQQELMLSRVERTGMICISDLVDNVRDIHPRNKRAIGERLAAMVTDREYGRYTAAYESPALSAAQFDGKHIVVSLSGRFEQLSSTSPEVVGLRVTGSDSTVVDKGIKLKGRQIYIPVKGIPGPWKVSYCFDDATIGSLRTEAGLPILPFRTKVKKQR